MSSVFEQHLILPTVSSPIFEEPPLYESSLFPSAVSPSDFMLPSLLEPEYEINAVVLRPQALNEESNYLSLETRRNPDLDHEQIQKSETFAFYGDEF
jgi:hypothetical protein